MGEGEDRVPWRDLLVAGHATPLALVCFGIWLHAADELIVATMMPAIVAEIGGAGLIAWNLALYELGSIIAGAVSALLTLRFGVRVPMTLAAAVFAGGCAVAALAPTMPVLLAGRLLQGLGGGGMMALAFIAVSLFFPARLNPRVLAAMSALWGVSAFLGPLVGGFFATYASWRDGFWFFGAQAAVLALWVATRTAIGRTAAVVPAQGGIPALRLAALAAGVLLIAFAATDASAAEMGLLVAAGVAGLALFLRLDRRADGRRLLPPAPASLLNPVGAGLVMVFVFSAATIPLTIYGPLLILYLHGSSAITAGYVIACSSIGWMITAILVSGAPERRDPQLILAGMAMVTVSILGFLIVIPLGPVWLIAVFAGLEGGGFGMAWTFILRRVSAYAPAGELERAAGAIPTTQRIGYAVGAAFIGIAANAGGLAEAPGPAVAATVSTWVFAGCLGLACLGFVAALCFVRRPKADRMAEA